MHQNVRCTGVRRRSSWRSSGCATLHLQPKVFIRQRKNMQKESRSAPGADEADGAAGVSLVEPAAASRTEAVEGSSSSGGVNAVVAAVESPVAVRSTRSFRPFAHSMSLRSRSSSSQLLLNSRTSVSAHVPMCLRPPPKSGGIADLVSKHGAPLATSQDEKQSKHRHSHGHRRTRRSFQGAGGHGRSIFGSKYN